MPGALMRAERKGLFDPPVAKFIVVLNPALSYMRRAIAFRPDTSSDMRSKPQRYAALHAARSSDDPTPCFCVAGFTASCTRCAVVSEMRVTIANALKRPGP